MKSLMILILKLSFPIQQMTLLVIVRRVVFEDTVELTKKDILKSEKDLNEEHDPPSII